MAAAPVVMMSTNGQASAIVPTAQLSVCSNTAQDYGFDIRGKNQDGKTVKSYEYVVEGLHCHTEYNWWWQVNSPITIRSTKVPQNSPIISRTITIPASYTNKIYSIAL